MDGVKANSSDLLNILRAHREGSDFLISSFAAAVQHYRCATVCTPFPQDAFRTATGEKNFTAARTALQQLPPVSQLCANPKELAGLSTDLQALLKWLLLHEAHHRRLAQISLEQLHQQLVRSSQAPLPSLTPAFTTTPSAASTLTRAIASNPSVRPQYIFQNIKPAAASTPADTVPAAESSSDFTPTRPTESRSTFETQTDSQSQPHHCHHQDQVQHPPSSSGRLSRTPSTPALSLRFKKSIFAFHGTSMENMHSILRSGLLNLSGTHLQRSGAIFGDGIYFSTDLGVAFSFCKPGCAWTNSCLGSRLRCLLVCELDVSDSSLGTKVLLEDGHSGRSLPPTYILVKSADVVHITHLLVYRDEEHHLRSVGNRMNLCTLIIVVYVLAMVYSALAGKSWSQLQRLWHNFVWQTYVG